MLIEILQDGAAVLERHSDASGVYTEELQTCAFLVFFGSKSTVFVHDSGQLSLNSIRNLLKKCGAVNRVVSIKNSQHMQDFPGNLYQVQYGERGEYYRKQQLSNHRIRLNELKNKENIFVRTEEVFVNGEIFSVSKTGEITEGRSLDLIAEMTPVPQRLVRRGIIRLNNAFSEKNSQSIKVDVQYKENKYTECVELFMSVDQMKSIASTKARAGDSDYFSFLADAKEAGVPI